MKTRVGLWIDHRKAIVVAITDQGEKTALIVSNTESQPRRSGDSKLRGSYEPHRVHADDIQQRAYTGHLNRYYDAIIACIGDAEHIFIFGPGEAKGELKKRLQKKSMAKRIAAVETVDKMTNHQIAAKVLCHFAD